MKIACVYHSIDLDGWMSAAIVKHYYNQQNINNNITNEQVNIKNENKYETIPILYSFKEINFIGYNYGQPIPDLSEYDKVIMCDISFPKNHMENIQYKLGNNFIWIDHHISAINDNKITLKDTNEEVVLYNGIRDTNYAACELTWKYFFPNEPIPEIVRLLGRYDCFGHKTKSFEMTSDGYNKAKEYLNEVDLLKEFENNKTSNDGYSLVYYANDIAKKLSEEQKVLEFQYGARQVISNYEEAYKYLIQSFDPTNPDVENIQYRGSQIYQYLCTEAKQAYANGFPLVLQQKVYETDNKIGIKLRKFICINKERFNPINFGIDYHKEDYDGCACFHRTSNGAWAFSLYNDNGQVDCSVIAKQFGGGGHKGAAGFILNDIEFINLLNMK